MKRILIFCCIILSALNALADDGYRLWLRYDKIDDNIILQQYRSAIKAIKFYGASSTISAAKKELQNGLQGLLDKKFPEQLQIINGTVIAGAASNSSIKNLSLNIDKKNLGTEGFFITTRKYNDKNIFVITANTDVGVLYGVFYFLRLLQTHQNIPGL